VSAHQPPKSETTPPAGPTSANHVVGEAMLTIQSDNHKHEILVEAARVLTPCGRYAMRQSFRLQGEALHDIGTVARKPYSPAENARAVHEPDAAEDAGGTSDREAPAS
jgi:methyltransferase